MTPKQFFKPLAEKWKERCEAVSYKSGTVKEQKAQLEFMIGATRAFEILSNDPEDIISIVNYLSLIICCGRNIVTEMDR